MVLQQTIKHRKSDNQMKNLTRLFAVFVLSTVFSKVATSQTDWYAACSFPTFSAYEDGRWKTGRDPLSFFFWSLEGDLWVSGRGDNRNYDLQAELIGDSIVFTERTAHAIHVTMVDTGPATAGGVDAVHSRHVHHAGEIIASHYQGTCDWHFL